MSLSEDKIRLLETFDYNADLILQKPISELIREEELGKAFSFRSAEESLRNIYELVKVLKESNLAKLPRTRLDSFNTELQQMLEIINDIADYTPNKDDNSSRQHIIEKINNLYKSMFTNIVPFLNYINSYERRLDKTREESKKILDELEFMRNEFFEKKSKALQDADEMLRSLKEIARESGVTEYSKIFADEANENRQKANRWLVATIILGMVAIVIAYFFLNISPESNSPTNYEVVHFALTKIIVFSILYYVLILFVKNYNSQRHNYVINKHRQNALTTFGTFVSSTKDIDTKNAVLIQATNSIFSNQSTGYIKSDQDSEQPNKLIEIIRAGNSSISK